MEEKDAWSVHVEYAKLSIALSTAVIAASVAIYVDGSKTFVGEFWLFSARQYLLFAILGFFCVLLSALLVIYLLASHFVLFQPAVNSRVAAWAKVASAAASAAAASAAAADAAAAQHAASAAGAQGDRAKLAENVRSANDAANAAKAAKEKAEAELTVDAPATGRNTADSRWATRAGWASLVSLLFAMLCFVGFFIARAYAPASDGNSSQTQVQTTPLVTPPEPAVTTQPPPPAPTPPVRTPPVATPTGPTK